MDTADKPREKGRSDDSLGAGICGGNADSAHPAVCFFHFLSGASANGPFGKSSRCPASAVPGLGARRSAAWRLASVPVAFRAQPGCLPCTVPLR